MSMAVAIANDFAVATMVPNDQKNRFKTAPVSNGPRLTASKAQVLALLRGAYVVRGHVASCWDRTRADGWASAPVE